MVTKIQKWGNSQGVRLPKDVLEEARLSVGEEVEISSQEGAIVLLPARRIRGKHDLKTLVARIPKDYRTEETDWGIPSGKEVW